jgi:methyl-accepting chemotaxis protein
MTARSQQSIRTTIRLTVGVAVAGVVGLGLAAVVSSRRSLAAIESLQSQAVLSLAAAADLAEGIQVVRVYSRDAILRAGEPAGEKAANLTLARLDTVETDAHKLDSLVPPGPVKEANEAFLKAEQKWREQVKQFVMNANMGNVAGATALLNGPMRETATVTADALDKDRKLLEAFSDSLAAASRASASATSTWLSLGALAALVGLGVLGFRLLRIGGRLADSTREINERMAMLVDVCISGLRDATTALAEGRLDVTVTPRTQPLPEDGDDEVAQLARRFNQVLAMVKETIKAHDRAAEAMRGVVKQADSVVDSARAGRLGERADAAAYQGAYRDLLANLNGALDGIMRPIEEATQVLERVAAKDLTARVGSHYAGDHARIANAVNQAAAQLESALAQVAAAAEQVAGAADQIAAGSNSLAQGTSEQASSLEEVSASLQETGSMAKANAASASEARALSERATVSVKAGVDSIDRLKDAMTRIKESADATARIVKTIDEIAFQTNLLALNAAVEAARAGDAGKGFAVVAEEVRSLAIRSADAARNTAELIEQSVRRVTDGAAISQEVSGSLASIADQVVRVREMMGEVSAASEQQKEGVAQINVALEQMNMATQGSAANAEESASAAQELSAQAQELSDLVTSFRLRDGSASARLHPARRPGRVAA